MVQSVAEYYKMVRVDGTQIRVRSSVRATRVAKVVLSMLVTHAWVPSARYGQRV